MVEINLGLSHEEANAESQEAMKTLPPGAYDLSCTGCKPDQYGSGRPCIQFEFEVVNHAEFNGKKLRHSCPLPYQGSNSGIGFLVDVTTAMGVPWTGASINTEDYVSRSCRANVINSDPSKDDQGRVFANIKSFVS